MMTRTNHARLISALGCAAAALLALAPVTPAQEPMTFVRDGFFYIDVSVPR